MIIDIKKITDFSVEEKKCNVSFSVLRKYQRMTPFHEENARKKTVL